MQHVDEIRSQLPFLRRYSRALTGSQRAGDTIVKSLLENLLRGSVKLDESLSSKIALYRAFHQGLDGLDGLEFPDHEAVPDGGGNMLRKPMGEHLRQVAPLGRQAFLLNVLEEFTKPDICKILELTPTQVEQLISEAARQVANVRSERILIIEDEMLIALDLAQTVRNLNHEVVEIVTTHGEAVRAAKEHQPGLILTDIKLAKGTSGIKAVGEILREFSVPVVFVTAFPERLLTGEQIEPAFLVTKPFQPESIRAAISQAISCKAKPEVVEQPMQPEAS